MRCPCGEGSQATVTPDRGWLGEPGLPTSPRPGFCECLDRRAFICMKIGFRKPLKCNKKVFNALGCAQLISTSLLDFFFFSLFFLFLPSLACLCCTNSPYGEQYSLETPSSLHPFFAFGFCSCCFLSVVSGQFPVAIADSLPAPAWAFQVSTPQSLLRWPNAC